MDLDSADSDFNFLDSSASELKSWLSDRGAYLFEERPEAVHSASIGLRAAYGDDEEGIDQLADMGLIRLLQATGTARGG